MENLTLNGIDVTPQTYANSMPIGHLIQKVSLPSLANMLE